MTSRPLRKDSTASNHQISRIALFQAGKSLRLPLGIKVSCAKQCKDRFDRKSKPLTPVAEEDKLEVRTFCSDNFAFLTDLSDKSPIMHKAQPSIRPQKQRHDSTSSTKSALYSRNSCKFSLIELPARLVTRSSTRLKVNRKRKVTVDVEWMHYQEYKDSTKLGDLKPVYVQVEEQESGMFLVLRSKAHGSTTVNVHEQLLG